MSWATGSGDPPVSNSLDLLRPGTLVHLIGVGGAGMSGIARILLQRGHLVTGSDLRESRVLEELRVLGARVFVGHDAANLGDADVVVLSAAVPSDNPELVAARAAGVPVLHRAAMLAALMQGDRAVLIAGTAGKTTTTSMAVVGLQAAGHDPSFAIGGSLNESGTNAHGGTDRVFVAEADESDRSFLVYEPDVAVVTNVELDHPDEFADEHDVRRSFRAFLDRLEADGVAVLGIDDAGAAVLAADLPGKVLTFGTDARADLRIVRDGQGVVRLRHDGEELVAFRPMAPGDHNVRNAAAALAVCWLLEVDLAKAARGIESFSGPIRRFQVLGEIDGIMVVDDYAHHPTKLRAALAAARQIEPRRIVLVVQPHRYSRTAVLGAELGRAAAAADLVIVSEVYASSETPVPGVTGRIVGDAAAAAGASVVYEPHLADIIEYLVGHVGPGDLLLTTGAGDVTQVGAAVLARLGGTR